MKTEIKFQLETPEDETRLELMLRADDLKFALTEILKLIKLSDVYEPSCKIVKNLELEHLLQRF